MNQRKPIPSKISNEHNDDIDRLIRERRQARLNRQRAMEKRRRKRIRRLLAAAGIVFCTLALVFAVRLISGTQGKTSAPDTTQIDAGTSGSTTQDTADIGTGGTNTTGFAGTTDPAAKATMEISGTANDDGTVGTGTTSGSDPSEETAGQGSRAALVSAEHSATLAMPRQMKDGKVQVDDALFTPDFTVTRSDKVTIPSESDVQSAHSVLIDVANGTIIAGKDEQARIYPASMTKVLTILTAAEHLTDPDETVTITQEITDYAYRNDCSIAGFQPGDTVTVRDLFYGTILPSGADAALALAICTAGSQEAFVELMNEKIAELGLSASTHFTNCVGIHDENNYSTCQDMALILKAALENSFCREVLTTRRYTTSPTSEHPEGIELSNWFLRRIEDKDSGGTVLAGKTGFVNESGNCAVSYCLADSGIPFICCTANAHSGWRCIYDHVALYKSYAKSQ